MAWERKPQADATLLSRPLELLVQLVVRFPRCTLIIAGIVTAASLGLIAAKLGFRTSRAELLSPKSDYNRRWLEYTREFGDKEDVVIAVEGEGRSRIVPVLDEICRELAKHPDSFGAVLSETDAPRLRAKGLYYLKTDELRSIDGFLDQATPVLRGDWSQLNLGGMAQWMGAAMTRGSPAERQQLLAAMQNELPRVINGLMAALGQDGAYQSPWPKKLGEDEKQQKVQAAAVQPLGLPPLMSFTPGIDLTPAEAEAAEARLLSTDGRMGFILLRLLEEDTQSFAQNSQSIEFLRQLIADIGARHPEVKIGLTGLPIIEYDEMRASERSMSLATVLSFLGVLAVMIVTFGGVRHSVMAMGALVLGMIWACAWAALTIGYLNILSIAFGSILFGLGIDYGIYYISHYLDRRRGSPSTSTALVETAGRVGPGILTGAVTAAIAFFAAGFTEFPGVAQLGLLAGVGILLCWLAQMTVLPALICLVDADGPMLNLPAPLDICRWLRPLFAFPRCSLVVLVLATLLTAAGVSYLRYDYNLLNLQPEGLESVDWEHKLFSQTNRSAWYALSIADTAEEALAKKEAFLRLPMVERVVEVASRLPKDVEEKRPLVESIHRRLANLPHTAPEIPVLPLSEMERLLSTAESLISSQAGAATAAAELRRLRENLQRIPPEEYLRRVRAYQQRMASDLLARLRALQAASDPVPPCVADLPEGVACRFVGKTGRFALQVYSKANIWEVGPMEQFVRQVRSVDPEATGNPLQVHEASRHMKRSFEEAACYALLLIVPVVLLDFRRLDHTLLALLPMSVGLLQTLGLMGLLDIPLNQANMILLPLVLGIGIEDGIHLLHDLRGQGKHYRGAGNAVIVAVVVNSLTTMVGFGALMIASHRGLQSLGRVLTLSMGCCLICSLLLPNLLRWGGFAASNAENDAVQDENAPESADGSLPLVRPFRRAA